MAKKKYVRKQTLTAREKKAILEKATFCSKCKDNTLAVSVSDAGKPLCRTHGG